MSNGWAPKQVIASGLSAFGANQANKPISEEFRLSAGGATVGVVFAIKASGVTGTCAATFQTGVDSYWEDVSSIAALSNGYNILRVNMPTDTAAMPLLAKGRFLLDTSAASGCTIESIQVMQAL